jgi:hypothetical protein
MIGQSEIANISQIKFIAVLQSEIGNISQSTFSTLLLQVVILCCAFYQPQRKQSENALPKTLQLFQTGHTLTFLHPITFLICRVTYWAKVELFLLAPKNSFKLMQNPNVWSITLKRQVENVKFRTHSSRSQDLMTWIQIFFCLLDW